MLTGGRGADVFLFTAKDDSGTDARTRDTITDFSQKGGDKIDLGRIGLDNGNGEDPFFTFLGKGAFTGKAGELRYEIKGGKTRVLSDLDGDGMGMGMGMLISRSCSTEQSTSRQPTSFCYDGRRPPCESGSKR